MAAIDMIKAQQAMAKAREDQRKQRLLDIAAERARSFAPVRAFVQELADSGALYTAQSDAYAKKGYSITDSLKNGGYAVCVRQDYVRFQSVRWHEHVTAACHWPTDEGTYPGAGQLTLMLQRDYPYNSDPVKYFTTSEDLIEALSAAIQHAISFPEGA